jgi:hypothetical protein
MNFSVIKFKQTTNTFKGYAYWNFIWYEFSFSLDPFVDMNFTTDTYRGYAYLKNQ